MLSIPFNSDMNGVCDTHHGATCEFRCNPGFRLVGNSVLTCGNTTDGQFIWDDVAPHCEGESDSSSVKGGVGWVEGQGG